MSALGFEVAIPSAGRPGRITDATLAMLRRGGVPDSAVTVFVPDAEQAAEYRYVVGGARLVYGHGWGMREARNAIARHYPAGTPLVQVDDDVTSIEYARDAKRLTPVTDLAALFRESFGVAGAALWCFYPVANAFFMWPCPVRRGELWYAVGALFGYVTTGHDCELVTVDDKEDFERSCRFYQRDGEVVRFDGYTFRTRYYSEPGGMQTYRSPVTIERGARAVAARYPDLATFYRKPNGRYEVKLRQRPTRRAAR